MHLEPPGLAMHIQCTASPLPKIEGTKPYFMSCSRDEQSLALFSLYPWGTGPALHLIQLSSLAYHMRTQKLDLPLQSQQNTVCV